MARSGYVIGLTIFVNADGSLGLSENGLRQNVLFLYHLFAASPNCAHVYLLNHGDGELVEDVERYGVRRSDVVRTPSVADRLDIVVSVGAVMERDLALRLRDRGVRFFAYKGGNGAVISMEAMVARPPRRDAERYLDLEVFDAVLMTPQHWKTYRGWCETLYRCPVRQVPQIWAPWFIQANPRVSERFGYQPGSKPWRIGVMEPNITVMKTSHLPMLICEAAFRRQPDLFRAAYITNGMAHADNLHFARFAASLSIVKRGVMTIEPRFVGVEFLADHADALVTHQWENGLNYLYYEALFGGYPLIHNSEFLGGLGYPYADFDAEDGARALRSAYARHDDELSAYRERAGELVARLDPESSAVIAQHEALLGLT